MIGSWERRIVVLVIASGLGTPPLVAAGDDDPCLGTFMGANLVDSFLDISLTTNSPKLLNGKENPKLRRFLEWRLASAIQNARRSIENRPVMDPVSLPSAALNSRHAIEKAKSYILDHHLQNVSLLSERDSSRLTSADVSMLTPMADFPAIEKWFSEQPLPPAAER